MTSKINKLINEVEQMSTKDQLEFIYKWHNGLTLAEDLKVIMEDKTFEFIQSADVEGYVFENEVQRCIIIDEFGNTSESDIDVHPIFTRMSQQRLAKTNAMLKAMGYQQ